MQWVTNECTECTECTGQREWDWTGEGNYAILGAKRKR